MDVHVLGRLLFIALVVVVSGCDSTSSTKLQHTERRLESISETLKAMYLDIGRFPGAAEGLTLVFDGADNVPGWQGPYADNRNLLVDGWGNEFSYNPSLDGKCFTLYSFGPNGVDDKKAKDDVVSAEYCANLPE